MRFFRLLLAGLASMGADPMRAAPASAHDDPPALQTEPDRPASFGYKNKWFAIQTQDGQTVAQALGLSNLSPANWEAGIAIAYEYSQTSDGSFRVFVSPPVEGWTLVVGMHLPYPAEFSNSDDELAIGRNFRRHFMNLASRFDEVQFFGTYRVVGFDAWARARGGRVERIFSFSDGSVLVNEGAQTVEEARLGFLDLGDRDPRADTELLFERASDPNSGQQRRDPIPDEQDTINLAGAWSIDPTQLENLPGSPGVGFIGSLPR